MSSFNAFYVKANGKATLDAMRKGFDQLEVEQYRDFIGIQLPGAPKKTPEEWLSHLSKEFTTDVFWLSFESGMDCFEFHHYQSGLHVRSLVFGIEEERMWERADGAPEPWEREFLFDPKNMEYELDDAEEEELKETIQRVYRDAKIEVGQIVPSISSKMTAEAIAHHYGFPHYGLS